MAWTKGCARAGAAVVALSLLGGCLVTASNQVTRSGNYISDATFNQIQPGKTSASWVKATLGEPTTKTSVDDSSEVWKYAYTETRDSSGSIFLLFGGNDKQVTTGNAFVEIKDGLVTRTWRG